MFLRCNTNNLAETVLNLFHIAINENYGHLVSTDYGVENVLVCDEMVAQQGEGQGSFIAGSSPKKSKDRKALERRLYMCLSILLLYFLCYGTDSNFGC